MPNFVKALIVFGVSMGISLLLAEGVCRLAGIGVREIWSSVVALDSDLGWQFQPRSDGTQHAPEFDVDWQIGPHSTRINQPESASPTGSFLLVGDSHNVGWGVEQEETLGQHLSGMLDQPVHIGGCVAYSTEQCRLWTQRHQDRLRPQTVVLAFYPGNDFMDNCREVASSGVPRPLSGRAFQYEVPDSSGMGDVLFAHSAVYRTLATLIKGAGQTPSRDKTMAALIDGAYTQYFEQAEFLREEGRRGEALGLSIDATLGFAKQCQDQGQSFAVILLPSIIDDVDHFSLSPEHRGELRVDPQHREHFHDLRAKYVQAISSTVACLDLSVAFQKDETKKQLFYPRDGHLNPEGHRWVAEQSIDFLRGLEKE